MKSERGLGLRRAVAVPLLALALFAVSCVKRVADIASGPGAMDYLYSPQASRSERKIQTVTASLGLAERDVLVDSEKSGDITARKIIRNGALDLLVVDVPQSVDQVGSIVSKVGGFVEKSTQSSSGLRNANLTVRVPAPKLDQVISDLKHLAITVDRQSVEARDVTHDYIDLDARLRNAQAEEAQYLLILKRATTIKDTLDVTEKLSDVRGRIERLQGEMKYLTSQIDMSTLEISLRSEADETVAGIHWRPLRQAKVAFNEMLSGMADWVDSVVAFFINLPLIIVWVFSIVVLLVVVVRLFKFLWRRLGPKTKWRFPWQRSKADAEQAP